MWLTKPISNLGSQTMNISLNISGNVSAGFAVDRYRESGEAIRPYNALEIKLRV